MTTLKEMEEQLNKATKSGQPQRLLEVAEKLLTFAKDLDAELLDIQLNQMYDDPNE